VGGYFVMLIVTHLHSEEAHTFMTLSSNTNVQYALWCMQIYRIVRDLGPFKIVQYGHFKPGSNK